jgi:hypothetical protein
MSRAPAGERLPLLLGLERITAAGLGYCWGSLSGTVPSTSRTGRAVKESDIGIGGGLHDPVTGEPILDGMAGGGVYHQLPCSSQGTSRWTAGLSTSSRPGR